MTTGLIKADLHLHSAYSNRPSEWFLKKLGASESYSDTEYLYNMSIQRGMDFVTITDHNEIKGSFELAKKYPENAISGVESTVYFPEDGCKVHILVYDLDLQQFKRIQEIRTNIYEFRDYIKNENLAYSVAHATYSVNGKLSKEHLEKLILLFDVFEVRNGSRSELHNNSWWEILGSLTKKEIDILYSKHKIEPISSDPWIKGFTGGSDDHAGLFVGKTFTITKAENKKEFLECLKDKQSMASGRINNFQGLVFAVYKIACDFARQKNKSFEKSSLRNITDMIFENSKLSLRDKIKISKMKSKKKNAIYHTLAELVESVQATDKNNVDERLDLIYDKITESTDEIFKILLKSFDKGLSDLNIVKMAKSASSVIPGIFITMPFFTSFKHMYAGRDIISGLKTELNIENKKSTKKILWFTDTINDLNGVSVTLKTIAQKAVANDIDIKFIASLKEKEVPEDLPASIKIIPAIHDVKMPYYDHLKIKVPSLLQLLKYAYEYNPDEIYISTPGPVGAAGLLITNLLNIKCKGIYHTDFTGEIEEIAGDEEVTKIVDTYVNWFFSRVDKILVPTTDYMNKLSEKGFERFNLDYFIRGIDVNVFKPFGETQTGSPLRLLYVGRVSQDKNIDFLIEVFEKLQSKLKNVKFEIVGDGPYFNRLYKKTKKNKNIKLTGKVSYEALPEIYNSADLFVFPSITDTFGMAVLEAQACGIPAIVSDKGGPREIIEDAKTGYSVPVSHAEWVDKIKDIAYMRDNDTAEFNKLKINARNRVNEKFNLDNVINDLTKPEAYQTYSEAKEPAKTTYMAKKLIAS